MGFFKPILDLGGNWCIVFGVAFGLFWLIYGKIWNEEKPRQEWIRGLRTDDRTRRYKLALTGWLDAFDAFLGNHEIEVRRIEDPEARENALFRNRAAWSLGLLDFTLLLAVAYPLFSLLVQWTLTGTDGRLGTLTVLPAEPEWSRRYATLGLLALSVIFAILARRALTARKPELTPVFAAFAGAIAGAVAFAFAGAGAVTGAVAGAGAGAGAVTGAVAFAGASAVTFAVTFAIAFAGTFAFADAFAGTFAVADAFAGAFAFPRAFAVAFAVAVAAAVAVAGAGAGNYVRERLESRSRRPARVLLVYVLIFYAIMLAASIPEQAGAQIAPEKIYSLLLFLGFFPLLNALADFVSTGLTRALMRRGTQPGRALALWSSGDFLAGAAVFILLGWAMIATVRLVAELGGPALIDLAVIFGDAQTPNSLRADPHAYWWLYATFLSTLLPTFLHLMLGVFSLPFFTPPWLRYRIAGGLEKAGQGDGPAGRWACLTLCLTLAASFTATAALLWYLARGLWFFHPHIGDNILWIFERFAHAIGALP